MNSTTDQKMVFDTSIMKWRRRTDADDEYGKAILREFGL